VRPAPLAQNPDAPRSLAPDRRTSDLKTRGSFPRPRVLTPTLSTTGLASRTEPPLQSAPSVSHLVRALVAETDWAPVVLLGSRLGIRSDKPVSRRPHPLLPYPGVCIPAGARGREEN